ncbi:MAG: hypothetical protein CMH27_05675 [Micavibrio sp.]|nr:hypothetical protein [Micavibrio sp.]
MIKRSKIMGRQYWKHAGVGVVAAALLYMILINLGVAGGVLWLRGDSGQKWVQTRLNAMTEQSGFKIDFAHFSYSFPQGLSVSGLSVADENGVVAELDMVTFRPKILPLATRHAELSVTADHVILHRLPQSESPASQKTAPNAQGFMPFAMPDLYFNRFSLNDVSIARLDIGAGVMGRPLVLSPDLYATLKAEDDVASLDMRLSVGSQSPEFPLPDDIRLRADLNAQSLIAGLSEFYIKGGAYDVTGAGQIDLKKNGLLDLRFDAAIDDLKPLSGHDGSLHVTARAGGTIDQPALNAEGRLAMDLLRLRGLGDIDFLLRMDDPAAIQNGHLQVESQYQGRTIEIAADITRAEDQIMFDSISGQAPDIAVTGQAVLGLDHHVVDGRFDVDVADLKSYSELAGFALDGSGNLQLNLKNSSGVQEMSAQAKLQQLMYRNMRAKSVNFTAYFPDVKMVFPGRLSADAQDIFLTPDVRLSSVKANIEDNENDEYHLKTIIKGVAYRGFNLNGSMDFSGVRAQKTAAKNIDIDLLFAQSHLGVSGEISKEKMNINAALSDFKIASIPADIPAQFAEIILNGDIHMTGAPSMPVIQADINSAPFSAIKHVRMTMQAAGGYQDDRAHMDFSFDGTGIDRFDGTFQMPMHLSFDPFVFDMSGAAGAAGGEIYVDARADHLSALLLPPGHRLAGDIKAQAALSGPLFAPDIAGTLQWRGGTYFHERLGAAFYDVNLDADLNKDHIRLSRLQANDGDAGMLEGTGRYDFFDKAGTDIELIMKNFHVVDSQRANGYASSDLRFQGRGQNGYLLSGDVVLGRFDVAIPERFQTSIAQLNVVEENSAGATSSYMDTFALDIDVRANDQVFVRGWGLDGEFSGDLDITGTISDPRVHGDLTSKRGRYEEFGRRFELERAGLRFQGRVPPSPYLDILATSDVGDIAASVQLSGSLQDPSIALSSVPSLPEDEIMSRVLFGRDMNTITPFQAVQLKNTLERFSGNGGGGFDPLGALRSVTGLDDIRVDNDDAGNASVGVGKYLTDKVYMELEQGAGAASGAASIQVEVTPTINVETEVGQDAQAGGRVLWHWDY